VSDALWPAVYVRRIACEQRSRADSTPLCDRLQGDGLTGTAGQQQSGDECPLKGIGVARLDL